jgi:octaheme c-type cytochrome (tetrathionate reductase family)
MKRTIIIIIGAIVIGLVLTNVLHNEVYFNLKLEKLKQEYAIKPVPSVDHSKFEVLNREFKTPQEVTETCISCHNERHKEIMGSSHWNWERVSYVEGRGVTAAGKKNVINNFCIGAQTNEQACAKCHIGYGMTNDHFDFNNARNVDCMVCHDNSEEYMKGASLAGYPDRSVNLEKVAQSVGQPTKHNCGSCHFNSGGGNNVKHGDLENSLLACTREVDVHMGANGMDMKCTACHTAENHQILGKLYSVSSTNTNRATCEQCHTNTPHFDPIINRHNAKVACQTCHIPTYAKVNATKMEWRWSESGKLKDGQPYQTEDEMGNHDYMSIKGSFKWEKNVKPDYIWFNGTADHYILGDTIKSTPVIINPLFGSHDDKDSKIIPVKIHVGDQIYDKVYKTLIQPKLYAAEQGDSAFWMDFDWGKAAEAGMKKIGLPYSGEYDFVETKMYWPVNHMVSKKDEALSCGECHTRSEDGRLAKLSGFYLPGRDYSKPLDFLGIFLFFASLGGVLIHAAIRIIVSIKNNKYETNIIDYDK